MCIFLSFGSVYANSIDKDWSDKAIEIILDIGENIEDDEYTYRQFFALREAICECVKPLKDTYRQQNFSGQVITNVAIGMADHDKYRLNQALIILQINTNNYSNGLVLIR